MFGIEPEIHSINTIDDLPPGKYVEKNLFLEKDSNTFLNIHIFCWLDKTNNSYEMVACNFVLHGDEITVKEAIKLDGFWRDEAGDWQEDLISFLPDFYDSFNVLLEEDRETFTLTEDHQIINRRQAA